MRDDTDTPLIYAAGGGLTELATAYLIEPRIATRLALVWIGGHGYDAPATEPEFNTSIDPRAAQIVFADAPHVGSASSRGISAAASSTEDSGWRYYQALEPVDLFVEDCDSAFITDELPACHFHARHLRSPRSRTPRSHFRKLLLAVAV